MTAFFFAGLLFLANCVISSANGFEKTIEIDTEALTLTDPLTNAGYGLVIPNYRPGRNDQPNLKSRYPFVDIVYKRFLWSELEPEEGKYNFSILENWIAGWKNRGYRVGFGVMSNTDGKQGTPLWVFNAGVPGVAHLKGQQIDPVMWNDIYLDKLEKFIAALGERLDGGRDVEFMDIRGIGMWGEMHFGLGIKGMWTQDELYDNGLSEDTLMTAYFRQMEYYKKAFPHTNLFLNISPDQKKIAQSAPHMKKFFLPRRNADYQRHDNRKHFNKPFILPISEEITKRAVALGIALRYDGLRPGEYLSSKIISSYFREYCSPGEPVKCFYEFAKKETDPGEIKQMLDLAVRDYASYININFQQLNAIDSETISILHDTAKKIGYQFYLSKLAISYALIGPENNFSSIKINHTWMNKGNIASPKDLILQFVILDSAGNVIADTKVKPARPVSKWLPGEKINLKSKVDLPLKFKEGKYTLAVRMHDAADQVVKINLKPDIKNPLFCYCATLTCSETNNGKINFCIVSE